MVTACLLAAGALLVLILYRTLEHSARDAADARARQIIEQIESEGPDRVDDSILATDGQIGVIQVVDAHGGVVAASAGAGREPIFRDRVPVGESVYLGNIDLGGERDYWIDVYGAQTPAGPVTVLVGADREPIESILVMVAVLLAVAAPIVITLVAVATYRLIGAALQPVESIRSRVASISSHQLGERVPVPDTGDEIARLAVTMNSMLARLEARQQAQQRFVADASHELRSPLATITAALELAHTRPDLVDAALVDDSLLPEAQRMHRLLEDLLLLARADENALAQTRTDVDVDDLLLAEAARVRRDERVEVHTVIAPVRVHGDRLQLTQVVRNLVDNACRHARTEVRLACSSEADTALIEITDDGPGIAEGDRYRIFERFVRLDSPRTRRAGGAGLGLAIAAEIVTAHGGSIGVYDNTSGGSRFVVALPADEG